MSTKLRNLLNASFDRELTPEEDTGLSDALNDFAELQAEKNQLQRMRGLMKQFQPSFDSGFSQLVMDRIAEERKLKSSRAFVIAFQRIALPLLVAASLVLFVSALKSGDFSAESIIGICSLDMENLPQFLLFNY